MPHAASTPNPQKIENIEDYLRALAIAIEAKFSEISDAQLRRIAGVNLRTPLWLLRQQLAELQEQFDLCIAELDHRRI